MQKMQNVVHANACDAVKEEPQEVSRGRTGTAHNFETGQRQSLNSLHSNFMADLTESDDDEASEAESFILDPEELEEEPVLDTSKFLLSSGGEDSPPEVGAVDPDTQARLEALLEATGLSKLSLEGKQLGDPEVLRRLTTSVSCALDEAAAALTRMRAEHAPPANTTSVAAVPMPPQGTHQTSRTLAEACSDGDVRAVRQLLDEGRDVNEVTEEGESLLSLACASGYTELAQLLLAMRANVEDRGLKDTTPLMEAANAGHVAIVRLLIEHGADVNAQTAQGHTPLMFACSGGHEEVARALVAAGANVEDHNENGHTPLMEAASAGHVSTARVLVEAGASINTHSNEFKESALTLACYKGHLEMVRFLLEAGADQEHKTDEMHTALMEASMDGHVEVARLLLDSGAQVNMPTDSFESPLTLAACGGHVELAMLLLERGANIEEVNDEGYTPLMEAAREGHEEMVALLLSQGADINAQTEETQETALTLACCGGFLEVADFLLKAGANLELGASTPLMEAAQEGHVELLRYLVNAGACVNAKTATGDTALTYACENGHTDVADLLLQANADLEHESEGGRTPLMKAARAGHLCTVQFLLSRGADPNRPTANNDHTALSLACAGGHLAVVELLLAHGADPTRRLRDNSTMLIEAAKGGHTAVVQLLLDYPNLGPSAVASSVEASSQFGSHGLQVVPLTEEQRVAALAAAAASHPYFPQVSSAPAPAPSVALTSRVGASSSTGNTDSTWTCGATTGGGSKRKASDGGGPPMVVCSGAGSRLASGVEGGAAALRPSERLEACINSMMRSAELNHPSREEQILQKQQILEELQRVERELQEKAQAQIVLSAHHHHQHPPALPCEDVEELNLRNAALSSSASPADAGCASLPPHSATCPAVVSTATTTIVTPVTPAVAKRHLDKAKSTKSSPSSILKETTSATSVVTTATASIVTSLPSTALHLHTQPPVLGLSGTTSVYPPTATTSLLPGATFAPPAVDEGLMVAAPARTLHETLGDIVTGPSASSTGAQVSITAQQSVCPDHHHHHHHHHGTTHPALSQQQPPPPPLAFHPFPVHSQVDLNWQTESNHDTALTLACAGGHEELVSLLLTRGAHLEHRDKKGFTPLMLAATAGHAGVVDVLLAHGAEVEAQSERTKDTALSLACSGGRYEVVEILLERNANKEHRNVSDYTPLSLAASGGYVNIIKLLLQNGAEINSRTGSKLGISPLMLAAMNGHTAAVKLLLDNGSDINAQIETNKNTALTLACFQGRQEVVALLVDRKANVEHRAKTGLTPLMEAASGGYVEVGRVLLDKGADVNAPPVPSSRDTALTIAADKGHYAFVELLIKKGAQIDVKNKKGSSPLWLACNGGHLDVVQLLVAAQADIDSMDNRRVSCLMAAFRRGHVKAAKWLVKHVAQFPSDQEMARFMATLSGDSKDLLRKCHQCTEVIHAAKERQAAEANKCASILLEELDQERSREESRKAAAARRRERKRRRKKEKQEQIRLAKLAAEGGGDSDAASKDNKEGNSKDSDKDSKNGGDKQGSSQSEDEDEEEEEEDLEEEDERLLHPGGAPASAHRNGNSNSVSTSNSMGKPKNSHVNGATNNKTRLKIADDDSHDTSLHQYSNHNESSSSSSSPPKVEKSASRNKKKQQPDRTTNHEASTRTNPMLTASTAPTSKGKSSGEKTQQQQPRNNPAAASSPTISTVVSSNHRQSGGKKGGEVLMNGLSSESEESSGVPKGSKHRSLYHAGNDLGKLNALDELVLEMNEVPGGGLRSPNLNRGLDRPSPNSNPSSSPKKQGNSLVNSLNNSLNSGLMSNKMHHRGEEGWKEVVRRSKKVTVPSTAISRVIGRCGCNINTIREVSGAHIEVEKHKGQGDRTILIRGSADATKQAQLLITGLVQEPERDLSEIMLQYGVGVKPSEPTSTAKRGGSGTTAVSSNHVQSSVVVAGGAKPIRQPSSTKVMSVKAAAPAPSLPPFGQTRPAPRPGIPTGSSNVVPTPAATNPPFTPSSWSSPTPPGTKGIPAPISSASQPATPVSMNSGCTASSANPQPASAASTTYTQAVISPAKSTSRAASADALPLSSPTGSPSPAPPQPPMHSHSAASTPPAAMAAPPISIPQTFSPFNNVFSKETQPSVWGQREALKPNFASVAASGVCCSSASSSTSSTGNPLPAPSPEPIIDAAKAPGYRGNLHVSPPNFGPIGSGPRSAPCTPPISAPAPPSASPSPPPQQQEYYDAPQQAQPQQAVASPASRLVFPGGRYCPELSQSPIQSTLNPNAPDFSSRAAPTMMPPFVGPPPSAHDLRVQFPPQDYMPHHPSQQPHHVQHQQMAQQHQPHHAPMFQLQMMSHLQQQYSGLVAQVAQHQVGKDDSSPSSVSPQGAMSPTTGGGLGPHQSGMLDDRKLPRPIGTERAQKKNVPVGMHHSSYPPPSAPGIWSYPNAAGNSGSSEMSQMAAWVQYQHAAGPQGDCLPPPLLHGRFGEGHSDTVLEHTYHQLNSNLGTCPTFLNGFPPTAPTAAPQVLGGCAGSQLFPSSRDPPHPQEAPWSPHKLLQMDAMHHHQPPHSAAGKLPWQGWAHHQT
ncbi:ankyrin repeat domain-containing protein 17-like isoform X2 [Ornithodoros turicata]|uniref:ankyrin repeat domain-containing protein 17-like isoform X2 n=1 Tax=Ornithodoros turicata TaxID=34597 RepID=UPI00313960C3